MRITLNKIDYSLDYHQFLNHATQKKGLQPIRFDNFSVECDLKFRYIYMAYLCPNCGCELYSEWRVLWFEGYKNSAINDISLSEQQKYFGPSVDKAINLGHCPLCAGTLSHKPGYFSVAADIMLISYKNPLFKMITDVVPYEGWDYIYFKDDFTDFTCKPLYNLDFQKCSKDVGIFKVMKKTREMFAPKEATEKMEQFCKKIDVPAVSSISHDQIELIKESPAKLKEHIQKLIKIEMSIYSVSQHLKSLYSVRPEVTRSAVSQQYEPVINLKDKIADIQERIEEMKIDCKIASEDVVEIKKSAPDAVDISPPQKPSPPVLETPGFFNKKRILVENEAKQNQYQLDLINYQEEYQAYLEEKSRLEQLNIKNHQRNIEQALKKEEIAKKILAKKEQELKSCEAELEKMRSNLKEEAIQFEIRDMIYLEINTAESTLKELYSCRNNLYAMDIVFIKYRNVVALSTFYEYLMAGRCTSLEGANGAYNLYEEQVRGEIIIGQLSQVIKKLDQIQENQYMIYSELQNVNMQLSQVNNTMHSALDSMVSMDKKLDHISKNSDIIAQNTDVIAHNTAVAAYYSKVNAELTNALGYMLAFK